MSGKLKILVFPFDLLSHYVRCIRLVEEHFGGHEVLFQSSIAHNKILFDENIKTFDCPAFDASYVMKCVRKFSFKWLNDAELDRVFLGQLQAIRKHKPDIVIGDTSATLKMAAEFSGTKFISLVNGYMSKYYALQRPMPSAHPAAFIQKFVPPDIFGKILEKAEKKAFVKIHKPFQRIRKKYGLKPLEFYLDEFEGEETLICDDPKVFPQSALPPGYRIIGPLLYSPKKKVSYNGPKMDPAKKNILVTFGSSGDWDNAVGLKEDLFSQYNIFTAGDSSQKLIAPHIYPLNFGDLNEWMPKVHLLICHGGNGTLNLAFKHRVPFICFPSIMEQEWNAARFGEVGVGITIFKMKNVKEMSSTILNLMAANH